MENRLCGWFQLLSIRGPPPSEHCGRLDRTSFRRDFHRDDADTDSLVPCEPVVPSTVLSQLYTYKVPPINAKYDIWS